MYTHFLKLFPNNQYDVQQKKKTYKLHDVLNFNIEMSIFCLLLTSFTSLVSVTGECIPRSEIISYEQLNNFCIYGSLVNFWT